jgi:hypothetical protein
VCIQVLYLDESSKDMVELFTKEKSRVFKGVKEAKWNHKYMNVIEKPVQ